MRFEGEEYRFGFGGQERDNEIYGFGNSYTAEYWQYDSRLGRRWNVDPITYPWQSPYSAFNNNPIVFNDPRGLQGNPANDEYQNYDKTGPDNDQGTAYGYESNDDIVVSGKPTQPNDNIRKPLYNFSNYGSNQRTLDFRYNEMSRSNIGKSDGLHLYNAGKNHGFQSGVSGTGPLNMTTANEFMGPGSKGGASAFYVGTRLSKILLVYNNIVGFAGDMLQYYDQFTNEQTKIVHYSHIIQQTKENANVIMGTGLYEGWKYDENKSHFGTEALTDSSGDSVIYIRYRIDGKTIKDSSLYIKDKMLQSQGFDIWNKSNLKTE